MGNNLNPNAASSETVQNMAVVMNLTNEQRLLLCDLGYYNEVIRGYVIRALEKVGYDDNTIDRVLDYLEVTFDDYTAVEARDTYQQHRKLWNES